jgi:hypothetical protein
LEPYKIITVRQSLEKSPSPIDGLAFQNVKRQLLSDELFDERHDTSYLDPLFEPVVDTSNLKTYRKYADITSRMTAIKHGTKKSIDVSTATRNPAIILVNHCVSL